MLRHLELTNFKCYGKSAFDFGNLTVFSGMNAAGKSTVLQALGFMRQCAFEPRHVNAVSLDGPLATFMDAADLVYDNASEGKYSEVRVEAQGDDCAFNCELRVKADRTAPVAQQKTISVVSMSYDCQIPFMGKSFVYIGGDRISPKSSYRIPASIDECEISMLGERCEYTAWCLNRSDFNPKSARAKLISLSDGVDRPLLSQQVSDCLSRLGRVVRVIPYSYPDISRAGFRFSFLEGRVYGDEHRPENVGYGLTSVLPIYTALLDIEVGGVAIVENPELHLHPTGQVEVSRFLAAIAATGVQVLVETHSDHVLNGMRLAVKKGQIPASDVKLIFIVNGGVGKGVGVTFPELRADGSISEWPDGFFDQYEKSLGDLVLGN